MTDLDRSALVGMLAATADAPSTAVEAIQHHGLASLLAGASLTAAEIAARSGLPPSEIDGGIKALIDAGRIDLEGEQVVGVGGLTLNSTVHSVRLPAGERHTWCALDAIGIPAALGLTATVETRCAACGDRILVDVTDGAASTAGDIRLFCPTGHCDNVQADFCSAANLFCNSTHLNDWRAANPSAVGEELDLDATVELGRAMWGRYRDLSTPHPADG